METDHKETDTERIMLDRAYDGMGDILTDLFYIVSAAENKKLGDSGEDRSKSTLTSPRLHLHMIQSAIATLLRNGVNLQHVSLRDDEEYTVILVQGWPVTYIFTGLKPADRLPDNLEKTKKRFREDAKRQKALYFS